jgi:uncharacterized protein YgiM (DUF1202 family)
MPRNILPAAVLAVVLFFTVRAIAENYYGSQYDTGGTNGSQISGGASREMVVSVDRGTLREAPRVQSNLLTTLPRGRRVTVVGTANGGGWAHVYVDGLEGYIDFVQLANPPQQVNAVASPTATGRPMIVVADRGNLREEPDVHSQLLMILSRGSHVSALRTAKGGSWARVQANGTEGWMDVIQLADAPVTSYAPVTAVPLPPPAPAGNPPAAYSTGVPAYQGTAPAYQYQSTRPVYQPAQMTVNGAGGTIHQTPDIRSPLLATLPPGAPVSVLGSVNGGTWAHVVANGVDGYMDYTQLR